MSYLSRQGVFVLVIDSDCSPQQLDPVKIVHGQDGAPLILVLDEAEALCITN